jgi:hypothetical protein
MNEIFGQAYKDVIGQVSKIKQSSDIEYLQDDRIVLFIDCDETNTGKINYCSGTELLGYSRKQIIGMDFTELIP